jgi:hypothetical protein
MGFHNVTLAFALIEQATASFRDMVRPRMQRHNNNNNNKNKNNNTRHDQGTCCGTQSPKSGNMCCFDWASMGFPGRMLSLFLFMIFFGFRKMIWVAVGLHLIHKARQAIDGKPRPVLKKVANVCGKAAGLAVVIGVTTGSSTFFWGGVLAGIMYGVGRAGGFERPNPRLCTPRRTKGICWCDEFVDFEWKVPPELNRS